MAEFNSLQWGLEGTSTLSGGNSLMDNIGDFVSKGIPLTGMSVVNSFANTGIEVFNLFGGEATKLSYESYDLEPETAEYYRQHGQGIEAAGLLVGSLIPMAGALKGYNLAMKVATKANAAAEAGSFVQRATNLLPAVAQSKVVEAAKLAIPNEGKGFFGSLLAEKGKAVALGFADQALMSLAVEAAIGTTMHASPLLNDQSFGEVTSNAFHGALLGGAIGGLIDGWFVIGKINKTLALNDVATKGQELVDLLGKGNFRPQDRMVSVLNSLDKMSAPTSELGVMKRTASEHLAETEVRSNLLEISGGDQGLAEAGYNILTKMREGLGAAGNSREELYYQWGRLNSFKRVLADSEPAAAASDTFYLQRWKPAATGDTPSFDQLWSTKAPPVGPMPADFDISLRYRIIPGATGEAQLKRWGEKITVGDKEIAITNQKQAWAVDADIYINEKGVPAVNPKSSRFEQIAKEEEARPLNMKEERQYRADGTLPPTSKPLYSTAQIWDAVTGRVLEDNGRFVPVAGDLTNFRVTAQGISSDEFNFTHRVNSIIDGSVDPLSMNTRYVWAANRGVVRGDTIQDPAMMEALYKDWSNSSGQDFAKWLSDMEAKKVTLAVNSEAKPLSEVVSRPEDILKLMAEQKSELIAAYLKEKPSATSIELQRISNMPENSLTELASLDHWKPEVLMSPISESTQVRHLKADFLLGNVKDADGNILRGMLDVQHRIDIRRSRMEDAAASWAGNIGSKLEDFKIAKSSEDFLITGAGAKPFAASQGSYGSAAQAVEVVGRNVQRTVTKLYENIKETLSPTVAAVANNTEAQLRIMALSSVFQRTAEKFVAIAPEHLPPELQQLGKRVIGLENALVQDAKGALTGWDPSYVPKGFTAPPLETAGVTTDRGLRTYYVLDKEVDDFFNAHNSLNSQWAAAENEKRLAYGMSNRMIPQGRYYSPPIDTRQNPFFAYLVPKKGTAFSDDGVGIITAENADRLKEKILSLEGRYDVYTKDQLAAFKKAKGDYSYEKDFYNSRVNSDMASKGILNDVIPETNWEGFLQRYTDFHSRMASAMTRNYVELANGQLFAELDAMSSRFSSLKSSKMQTKLSGLLEKSADDPFEQYKRTALNLSPRELYPWWNGTQEKLEATADSAFRTMKEAVKSVRVGVADSEFANKVMMEAGIPDMFGSSLEGMNRYGISQQLPPAKFLSKVVAANNGFIASSVIKFDALQQFIDAITTPIMIASEGAHVMGGGWQKELLMTPIPGQPERSVFAVMKPIFEATMDFFRRGKLDANTLAMYERIAQGRGIGSEALKGLQEIALPMATTEAGWSNYLAKANDILSTPFRWQEEYTNFITARVGHKIFEAQGFTGKALEDNLWSFMNRVKTNVVSSQRPVAFQGPIGQSIGLFQSFYLNLLQNMFRYVEHGEGKVVGLTLGLQNSLFGVQGLPGFEVINKAVATLQGNNSHADFYSVMPNYLGDELAKFVLYGSLSNVLGASAFTRGDINPRSPTVIPVNPTEWAGLSGSIKFASNLYDMAGKMANGGDVVNSLLLGLEHNGISRPLTGLAQIAQGFSSSSKGSLIAVTKGYENTGGLSELFMGGNFGRLLGSRPLDEGIALNDLYRRNLYHIKDAANMEEIGQAFKSHLISGAPITPDLVSNFASRYAAAGGQMQTFGTKIKSWMNDATTSQANEVFKQLADPRAQQAMRVMGGKRLPDYNTMAAKTNTPAAITTTGVGDTEAANGATMTPAGRLP